jgi:AAA domain
MVLHAHSKQGKSTLGATAPLPIVLFDAEGGTKFLAGSPFLAEIYGRPFRITEWNTSGPPPLYDGTWDAAVVTVHSWQDFASASQWLHSGQHHFTSLVVDSVTEIQRRLKKNLVGTDSMKIQNWGDLLTGMDDAIRGLRDLTNNPYNPLRVAVFIAETRQNGAGKFVPYMQGQIATALPYWVDIVGWLFVDMLQDAAGQPTIPVRKLLVNQHAMYEAGERVQGLVGPVIDNPRIYSIVDAVYPNYVQPQPQEEPAV